MGKTAFVFPGQGSQSVGMGRDFFEASPTARRIYETFDRLVDPKLSDVCFNGPEDELKRTLYTQPAILATAIAALELFREKCDATPDLLAGHSLGEYGALYAAGVIDLETAARLVRRRAELMEAASAGAMSAVLNLPAEQVEAVVNEYARAHNAVVTVANYNTDAQLVISGEPAAVEGVAEPLKAAGAKRVLPLPVGGAFHSPLMAEAASSFAGFLKDFAFHDAAVPVVTNVDAALTTAGAEMQAKLGTQIDHSVRWMQTMQRMVQEQGVDTVIEFGPGKVLTGMFKKMFPDVAVYNVFDQVSLEATLGELKVKATV